MTQVPGTMLVVCAVLAAGTVAAAHHSIVQFDTAAPVRLKGRVVRFEPVQPHVRIVLDERREDGGTQRWIVDGPSGNNIARMRIGDDFLKPGDAIEVCGFPLKKEVEARRRTAPAGSPAGASERVFSGHLLVTPDGRRRFWSDYGVLDKCLEPGEDKETLRREAFGQ